MRLRLFLLLFTVAKCANDGGCGCQVPSLMVVKDVIEGGKGRYLGAY